MRLSRNIAAAVLVLSLVAALVPGFGASLGGLTERDLGADGAVVAACDTNGFSVSYTTSAGNVTAVVVSAIADPGCEGGQLSLRLANSSGTSIGAGGPQTIPTDGDAADNSITVSLSPTPPANTVAAVHIVVTGP